MSHAASTAGRKQMKIASKDFRVREADEVDLQKCMIISGAPAVLYRKVGVSVSSTGWFWSAHDGT